MLYPLSYEGGNDYDQPKRSRTKYDWAHGAPLAT